MGYQKFKFLGDLVVVQQYRKGNLDDDDEMVNTQIVITGQFFIVTVKIP